MNDVLEYPNLTVCQLKLMGSAATSRPPVRLPRAVRESAQAAPSNGNGARCSFDDFSLEHAVLKRKEEREREWVLKGSSSREALERATIAKMKNVTGADQDVRISVLRDHGYDVEESIEAYLDR
mmetsp:Transcript_27284/g.63918  ORF Transcript_27284/g.63918 Transcript_27284/m.63918 type:complete len:124 (-) Transcript_27284:232-603(-)